MGRRITMAVLALVALATATGFFHKSVECRQRAQRIDELYHQAKTLEGVAARRGHQLDSLQIRVAGLASSPIQQLYIDRLRDRGLRDPVAALVANLQSHPELIPYPGIEGSKMGFHDTDRIRILTDRWAYAPFEDGHIGGEAIVEYSVAAGGAVSWKVVKARLDQ